MPLLAALAALPSTTRRGPLRPFLLGLTTGGCYFAGTLYWVGQVMEVYGGLSWTVSIAVAMLLVAYLALFPAAFALIVSRLLRVLGPVALLLSPAAWVTTEFARSYLLSGFPWVLLGYSQATALQIAQVASLVGVYGLSALVAFVNGALAYLLFTRSFGRRVTVVTSVVTLIVAASVWGTVRIQREALVGEGTPFRVGIVQGNVPQDQKWDAARASAIFSRYMALSEQAANRGARLIVWPESSTPFVFEEDAFGRAAIDRLARASGAYFLIGSDQIERGPSPKYYNAAFLVSPEGRTLAVYRKMHLVPFGEYVPLKRILFFAAPLVEAVSDFSAGDRAVLLPFGAHPLSTSICYEIVYPDLVRHFVLGGSQVLTTITNDAWFGRSSAAEQHFEQASMRAIEEGRYLVRSANTGISGIVDPYGRVLGRSDLFQPAVLVGEVRALTGLTLYARIGDLVAYLAMALTVAALTVTARRRYTT